MKDLTSRFTASPSAFSIVGKPATLIKKVDMTKIPAVRLEDDPTPYKEMMIAAEEHARKHDIKAEGYVLEGKPRVLRGVKRTDDIYYVTAAIYVNESVAT